MYTNHYVEFFSVQSLPLDQTKADQICAAIQKAVGGRITLKATKGGVNKNGNKMPDYFLEATTAEIENERKAYGELRKAQREAGNATQTSGDGAL
jgi:hypothetical protein